MPLPLILGIGAVVAGVTGVGAGISGAVKMKGAKDTIEVAQFRHKENENRFKEEEKKTNQDMDKLGKLELEITKSFGNFADLFEKIKNRPTFQEYSKNGVILPKYNGEELKKVSIGAGVLLGSLGGAGMGTAGAFAASGATTAAVMALGTASTGTAISSLSGAAATNAILAALGGGSIAAGGGGMALGTAILGASTLGVGLLVGGIIFNATGGKLSEKADEAWAQMKEAEEKINKICDYLTELRNASLRYYDCLSNVNEMYQFYLFNLRQMVEVFDHCDWNEFTEKEKLITENTVLIVGLLYNMCKIELVKKSSEKDGINSVNTQDINSSINNANVMMKEKFNC